MKYRKFSLFLFTVILLFSINTLEAQEKVEYDKAPKPIGGIESIMKNVVYPEEAKKSKVQGKVFVNAVIDEKGNVIKTEILKSDNELINQASLKAVKVTKFTPAELNGKKVKSEVVVPIQFKLS